MSTAKAHTPGEWYVGHDEVGQGLLVFSPEGAAVANCGFRHGTKRSEAEANARLISAAPDLLKALEAVRQSILDDARPMTNRQHDAIVKADTAIRKARGQ